MTIDELMQANQFYQIHKKEVEEEYKEIRDKNAKINFAEFEALEYSKMKEVVKTLHYCCPDSIYQQLMAILEKKRIETYPILKGAVYYKELNQYTLLPIERIKLIDNALSRIGNFSYLKDSFLRMAKLSREESKPLFEFLYQKGIVERKYYFICDCGECGGYLSEEEYQKLKNAFEHPEQCEDMENYFFIFCHDCDGTEITNKEQLEKKKSVVYKLCKTADLTTDSF